MSKKENDKVNKTAPKKAKAVADLHEAIDEAAHGAPEQPQWSGIAILGSNPATIGQAPFNDPRWRIYACSPHNIEHRTLPHVHEWFEVHEQAAHQTRQYEYLRRLEENKVAHNPPHAEVIWVRDKMFCARGRDFRMYPEKEMQERWGPFFFTSSIAYMLAKAIVDAKMNNIPKIGIWGVMQASENEYCMVPETRALTADLNWVPVGDLKVGQELLAFDEHPMGNARRQWRKATVDATGSVKRDCYTIHAADGTSFTASFDHKWLNAEQRWVKTKDLRADGDYPSASRLTKLVEPWSREETWDAGYLAGAIDADGCLTQYSNNENSHQFRVSFAQKENAARDCFLNCARNMGFDFSSTASLDHNLRGGKSKTLEFLGRVRPPRLLSNLDASCIGEMRARAHVPIEAIEHVGEREVTALSTSTGTFVAEGFATHNTYQRPGIQYFIWRAEELGIEVLAPRESRLFEPQQVEF